MAICDSCKQEFKQQGSPFVNWLLDHINSEVVFCILFVVVILCFSFFENILVAIGVSLVGMLVLFKFCPDKKIFCGNCED